jgi:hypothetical protein
MSELFNLSITSYNINELKSMLNLQDPFTIEDIVNSENILREKLFMDAKLSKNKKDEIIKFLSEVKGKLIEDAKKHNFLYGKQDRLSGNGHIVQERPGRSVSSLINPVPRDEGANEGTSKHTIHRLLCLDSRFRENYYNTLSTNYNVTLPTTIKNVISMELSALEFPSTYFQISKSLGNNFFWIGWSPGPSPVNLYYISIPDVNYQRIDIQRAINEQIKIALNITTNTTRPVCVIDEHTTKTTISVFDVADTTPQLYLAFNRSSGDFDGGATTNQSSNPTVKLPDYDLDTRGNGIVGNCGWILGYRLGEYTGSWSYVSEGCYDAWGTKYIYIVVNDFNKNVNNFVLTSYNESIGKSNVLARISTQSAASNNFSAGLSLTNDTVTNDSSIKKRFYFGPVDIKRLELQILDEYGRVIDLNNMDYSMAINLVCLYD